MIFNSFTCLLHFSMLSVLIWAFVDFGRVTPRDRQRVEMGRLGKMQLELNQALIPT